MTETRPAPLFEEGLIARLPEVRGQYTANAPLKDNTWFRVGGPAEVLYKPADSEDLSFFLKNLSPEISFVLMGVGSNTLVRSGGVPGVVLKLGPSFSGITVEGETLHAGAAALDLNVARAARDAGLMGMEFLSGIPGTLGGAMRMNAGSYGSDIKHILETVTIVDHTGTIKTIGADQMALSYRQCDAPADWIFLAATLRGKPGDKEAIAARMKQIQAERTASQPIHEKTSGSTFANPPGAKAWELIEAAGGRNLRIGGAVMSDQHCNFMINTGAATPEDLETLGEEVRRRVKEKSGLELRWEIRIIGIKQEKGTTS